LRKSCNVVLVGVPETLSMTVLAIDFTNELAISTYYAC